MIRFDFSIANPFKHLPWRDLYQDSWSLTKNKTLEIGFFRHAWNIFELAIDLRWKGRDHAGPKIDIGILGWQACVSIVDNRHWSSANHDWETYHD